jgi:DNA-binding MurR/RpiR family transcriptional regulator
MRGHGAKLPRKKQQTIAALIEHPTIKKAAEAAGIGEATLFRWMQDKAFQRAYRQAKRQVVQQAITKLQRSSGEAVEVLRKIMNDSTKPPGPRVTAARTILDMAVRVVELEDLESRVEEIERKLGGKK